MGDLYLHLAFARRLRFAEGMHPLVREAMVRRSPFVALGASLRFLPDEEQKTGSFLRRLFKLGRADADRWIHLLTPEEAPRAEFVSALLSPPTSGPVPGPLTRVALAVGALSHELLSIAVAPTVEGLAGVERAAVQRGQCRLWLQSAIPVQRHLQDEWAPALQFVAPEAVRPMLSHVAVAMGHAFGQAPQRELVSRWAKCLAQTVFPLAERSALPEPGFMADHTVREQYFDGDAKFLERTQDATSRAVFLTGLMAERFVSGQPGAAEISELLTKSGALPAQPEPAKLQEQVAAWHETVLAARDDALSRGRNPRAAYHDDPEASGPLPPLPADGVAPNVTQEVSLADIEAEVAKNAPAMTQEVSLADIENELGESGPEADLPTAGAPSAGATPPPAPANTQQISLSDIEDELAASDASSSDASSSDASSSDAVSASPPRAPANTQQVSLADIEAEIAGNVAGDAEATPAAPSGFHAPAHTQQVLLADIEAEMAGEGATNAADPSSLEAPGGFKAPAHTQQVSLADIEAEIAGAADAAASGAADAAPAVPQDDAADRDTPIERPVAEVEAAVRQAGAPPPPPMSNEGPPELPPSSGEGPPVPPPTSAEGEPVLDASLAGDAADASEKEGAREQAASEDDNAAVPAESAPPSDGAEAASSGADSSKAASSGADSAEASPEDGDAAPADAAPADDAEAAAAQAAEKNA